MSKGSDVMKKPTLGVISLLFCILLIGCQQTGSEQEQQNMQEKNKQEEVKQDGKEVSSKKEEKQKIHEGKEQRSVDELEEHQILKWDLADDMSVYVVKENGTIEVVEETTALSKEGEKYFEGEAALFIAYHDEGAGYLQEEIPNARIRIEASGLEPFTIGEDLLIGWTTNESSTAQTLYLWTLQNEELHRVEAEGQELIGISHQTMKVIDDQYWQIYNYNNTDLDGGTIGWYFKTYKWDQNDHTFSKIAEEIIENDLEGYNQEFIEEWHENKDAYVNFGQYTITEEAIQAMKNGSLLFDDIKIGQNIQEVEDTYGEPADRFYDRGAPAIAYHNGFMIAYDEIEEDVLVISVAGNALSNSLQELRTLLGEPKYDEYFEYDDAFVAEYILESYSVIVRYDEDDRIYEVELRENHS